MICKVVYVILGIVEFDDCRYSQVEEFHFASSDRLVIRE